jgi:predicted CXXCH cytochrome family protein
MRTERRPHVVLRGIVLAVLVVSAPLTAWASPGSVVRSKHNLSSGGPGSVKSGSETQVCVFCHAPHNADPAPQLWNHQTSGAVSYTAYGSSSFDSGATGATYNSLPGTAAGQPTGSSRLCLSCHDGTIALGATLNNGTISMGGASAGFIPPTANLGLDLSNDHPVSFARNAADLEVRDPAPGDPVKLEAATNFVQCISCHDPHEQGPDPAAGKFLVKANARSALCTTCHEKGGYGWSWATSPHSTSTKSYTAANNAGVPGLGSHTGYATVADNGCESCHRAHSAPQAQRLLKAVSQRDLCFQCHGDAPVAQKSLAPQFAKARTHPIERSTSSILHDAAEVSAGSSNFAGARRHVDCADCHNPHGVSNHGTPGSGLHTVGTNVIDTASVLTGVAGVEPSAWPVPPGPGGTLPVPGGSQAGYTIARAASREYQVCFKCHTSYAFGAVPPSSSSGGPQTDAASDFSPANGSYHPVVGPPHQRASASSLLPPWNTLTSATRMYCTDCHGNDQATSATEPQGPHGSANPSLLRFSDAAWSATGPSLNSSSGFCFNCHAASEIRQTNGVHSRSAHQSTPCQSCHVAVPHGLFRPSLIALTKDPMPYNRGAAMIIRWQRATTPNGYSASDCYSTVCHAHNDSSYAPVTNPSTYY